MARNAPGKEGETRDFGGGEEICTYIARGGLVI